MSVSCSPRAAPRSFPPASAGFLLIILPCPRSRSASTVGLGACSGNSSRRSHWRQAPVQVPEGPKNWPGKTQRSSLAGQSQKPPGPASIIPCARSMFRSGAGWWACAAGPAAVLHIFPENRGKFFFVLVSILAVRSSLIFSMIGSIVSVGGTRE
jgi:hypothetical protein